MSKPRKKPPARKESRGRTYTISCTDEQWAAIQDGAERAGKNVSTWFVECALTVDPWPRKHRRLVLNEREQRRHARAVAVVVPRIREGLNKCLLHFSDAQGESALSALLTVSVTYRHRKWWHIPVPREPLINQRFLSSIEGQGFWSH